MIESYTLCSGSSGNSIFLRYKSTSILVDSGMSMKKTDCALKAIGSSLDELSAIFITHEHSDHIGGLGMIAKHKNIPIFLTALCAEAIYTDALNKGKFAEAEALRANIRTVKPGESYDCNDLIISPFATPHDSIDSVGYTVGSEKCRRAIGIATDIGHISSEVQSSLIGCRKVIIESNHDPKMLMNGPYPYPLKVRIASQNGHLSNPDCAAFLPKLLDAGCENFALFHLSLDNNEPEIALNESVGALKRHGAREGDYTICVARRSETTKI